MKKMSLVMLLVLISTIAQAHTAKEIGDKIQPVVYNLGQYAMYSCIKSDYFFSDNPIQENQINSNCRAIIEQFYPIETTVIDRFMDIVAEDATVGKTKEVSEVLSDYTVPQKKALVDFYEIVLRTYYPLGFDDPMTPKRVKMIIDIRKALGLPAMTYESCMGIWKDGYVAPNCESLKAKDGTASAQTRK